MKKVANGPDLIFKLKSTPTFATTTYYEDYLLSTWLSKAFLNSIRKLTTSPVSILLQPYLPSYSISKYYSSSSSYKSSASRKKSFNPTRCQMKMFSSNRILFTKGRSSTKRRQSVFWTRNKTPPPTLLELLRRFHKKRAFWRRLKTRYSFTFWKRRTKPQTGMLNPRRCSWLLLLSDYQSHKRADNITKRRH